jgi:hypothetical protein
MKAHFSESSIHSDDLGLFAPYLFQINGRWDISADFEGTVDDFWVRNTRLGFGEGSRLVGDFGFKGLPEFGTTFMDLRMQDTYIRTQDLVPYYPEWEAHTFLAKLNEITANATYLGDITDFTVKGDLRTGAGDLSADLAFHVEDLYNTTYRGMVQTMRLELGKLVDHPKILQQLDFSGKIEGKGFELTSAKVDLNASVQRIGIYGSDFRGFEVLGLLQGAYFKGLVQADDPDLAGWLSGEVDLSDSLNTFDLAGTLERVNMQRLGWTQEPYLLKSTLTADLSGNEVNELLGNIKLSDVLLTALTTDRSLAIDTLLLDSYMQGDNRHINLRTDFVEAAAEGTFRLTDFFEDLDQLIEEYRLSFFGSENERLEYYRLKQLAANAEHAYTIDFSASLIESKPLMAFLSPGSYFSPGTTLEGRFEKGNTALLTVLASADSIQWAGNAFNDIDLDITTSKRTLSGEVLASLLLTSSKQKFVTLAPTEGLRVETSWFNDHIRFTSRVGQVKSTNRAVFNGEARLLTDGMDVRFKNAFVRVLDDTWQISNTNVLTLLGNSVELSNVYFQNTKQKIAVDGRYAWADSTSNLLFEVQNLRLASLNPLFETKLEGIVDGTARLQTISGQQTLSSALRIEGLGYDGYEIGNMKAMTVWEPLFRHIKIDAALEKNTREFLSVRGYYNLQNPEKALALRARLSQASLEILEPFTKGIMTDLEGMATGELLISGAAERPVVEGEVGVQNGKLKVDYLQTTLGFSDRIQFSDGKITASKMLVNDAEGNRATLSGGAFHSYFTDFTLDLRADMQNFKILNTQAKDNDLFYGQAYATGLARMYGPIENLAIEANVTSNKGTRIFIPMDGAAEVSTQEYIQFVSKQVAERAEAGAKGAPRSSATSGIKMDFNFNITPDAYCEIQLDRQAGDIIKAYGQGLLNMKIDTKGDFTMLGNYVIERGDYTFTFQNAFNKKFDIKPGSQISWTGDPYEATLDVTAAYIQLTSLAGVLPGLSSSSATGGSNLLNRRYPVEITITLQNRLLSPDVGYQLSIKEYPASGEFRSAVAAFENRLMSDEQELSRQVSSMILFNQLLTPQDAFLAQSNQNFLSSSMSELVSNQISKWASAVDENLEIGLSGLAFGQNPLDNLQLRFSYRFLNDRFRITRDGRLGNAQNQYDAASIVGEWTLEYWLNTTGSMRLKAYNRNIQSPLLLNNTLTTGGISMQFTHSFNQLRRANASPVITLPPPPLPDLDTLPKADTLSPILTVRELLELPR